MNPIELSLMLSLADTRPGFAFQTAPAASAHTATAHTSAAHVLRLQIAEMLDSS